MSERAPATVHVALRMTPGDAARVDGYVAILQAKIGHGVRLTRADGVRSLVLTALDSLAQPHTPAPPPPSLTDAARGAAALSADATRSVPSTADVVAALSADAARSAPSATEIRRWQQAGESLRAIADRLNTEAVPTLSGKGKWHESNLSRMLAKATKFDN